MTMTAPTEQSSPASAQGLASQEEETGRDGGNTSFEQMARTVTAPRLRDANLALPLNPNIAAAFDWLIELSAGRPQISLAQLTDVRFVNTLNGEDRQLCWAAVRVALDSEVKYGTLPNRLLQVPVSADACEDVRSFLSTRGLSREHQPAVLTIEHARTYIGRRVSRLLECLPVRRATDALASLGEDSVEPRVIAPPTWFEPMIPTPAKPRALLREEPTELTAEDRRRDRAQQRAERRRASLDDLHWHESRLHQSEEIRLLDGDGLSVSAQDPRLGRLLLALNEQIPLRGETLAELRLRPQPGSHAEKLVDELSAQLARARSLTAAEEVRELLAVLLPPGPAVKREVERGTLIEHRYGLEGRVLTLSEVGELHGLTRERIRQVQEIFEARLSVGTVYAPRLHACAELLRTTSFAPLTTLRERAVQALGSMALEGALDLMERVLAWPLGGKIAYGQRNATEDVLPLWTHSLAESAVSAVLQQAYAMSMMAGAFQVTTLIGLVAEHSQRVVSREQIHMIMNAWPAAHWIDETGGWGWVDGVERSPIVADVRKMLAVAQPLSVDIEDLYAGLARSYRSATRVERLNRFSGLLAPTWVIQALLAQLPEFRVAQQDNFRLNEPVDAVSLMDPGTELMIYREMLRLGGVATWQQLRSALVDEQGVNAITFGVILKNRCWMDQPGFGVYALRGYRLQIEQLRVRGRTVSIPWPAPGGVPAQPALRAPPGFEGESCFGFTARMTNSTKPHRVLNLPARACVDDSLSGDYTDQSGDSQIRVGRTQISRLIDLLEAAGVAPGELITIWLDPTKRVFKWERSEPERDQSA